MEQRKSPTILIVILILMVLGLGGYIVYDKFIKKTDDDKYETVINDVSVDVNGILKVSKILDTLDNAYNNNDSNYFGYIYKIKTVDAKNYDIKAAIFSVVYNNMIRSNTEQTLSNNLVKNQVKNIFGLGLNYTPSSLDTGDSIKINYNEQNKNYTYTASIPTGSKNKYYTRNVKTSLNTDTVMVTRKVFYAEVENTNASIYTDSGKKTKIGTVPLRNGEIDTKEVTSKYGSKLITYEYTFKYDLGEYYLHRIERVS